MTLQSPARSAPCVRAGHAPRHTLPVLALLILCASKLAAAITICVVHDPPFTVCPSETFEGFVQEESSIRGVDVETIRWLLADQGFTWDRNAGYADPKYKKYSWRCSPSISWARVDATIRLNNISSGAWPVSAPPADPTTAVKAASGAQPYPFSCDIGLGNFAMTSASAAQGAFYIPYYQTGAGILTLSSGSDKGPWAFVHPFDWTLWLAFLGFCLIIPAAAYFSERLSMDGSVRMNREGLDDWRLAQYHTLLAVFNLQVHKVFSVPAQIKIVAFCFMVLIVVQTYNAQLGALLTNAARSSTINSINDLSGKNVGTVTTYSNALTKQYSDVNIKGLDAANADTLFSTAVQMLQTGELDALIYDVGLVTSRISSLPDPCSVRLITDPLPYKITYGMLFNSNWDPDLVVKGFYNSMWRAREWSVDAIMDEKYVGSLPTCTGLASPNGVTFTQMSGLFIAVGAVTAATLLVGLVIVVMRIYEGMHEEGGPEGGEGGDGTLESKETSMSSSLVAPKERSRSLKSAVSRVFSSKAAAVAPEAVRPPPPQQQQRGGAANSALQGTLSPFGNAEIQAPDRSDPSEAEVQAPPARSRRSWAENYAMQGVGSPFGGADMQGPHDVWSPSVWVENQATAGDPQGQRSGEHNMGWRANCRKSVEMQTHLPLRMDFEKPPEPIRRSAETADTAPAQPTGAALAEQLQAGLAGLVIPADDDATEGGAEVPVWSPVRDFSKQSTKEDLVAASQKSSSRSRQPASAEARLEEQDSDLDV